MLPGYNILTVSLMLLRLTQPEDWSVGLNWFALLLRRVAHGRKVKSSNTLPLLHDQLLVLSMYVCLFILAQPHYILKLKTTCATQPAYK